MVWLHGGGFATGSANFTVYDGVNLAAKHDVVLVGVNHRLNIFGFLHLGEIGGERFAKASNAGMLDIVAALEWVRDNISNFGGDPNTVMIFGQSGGGRKVETLLAMPSAKGLFHRATIESGAALQVAGRDIDMWVSIAVPPAVSTAFSTTWSSSRMFPGHACRRRGRSASLEKRRAGRA